MSIDDDLVEILPPSRSPRAAEEGELHLVLHARGLTSVQVAQYLEPLNARRLLFIQGSLLDVPLIYQGDGDAVIRVTPLRMGRVVFRIDGRFPDGRLFGKSILVNVDASSRQPLKMFVADGAGQNGTRRIVLFLQHNSQDNYVTLHAVYAGVTSPIPIDAASVQYTLRANDKTPPVELDESTGRLKPTHPGHVIVESVFAGTKSLTCVVVNNDAWSNPLNLDGSMCQELLEPGEALTSPK